MKTSTLRKIVIACFIAVPLLSSIISTIHIVDLFTLGNPSWISLTLAIAIEVGSIASFLTLSILGKLNKGIVWSMFTLLFIMQIVGNMYFSYDWITVKMLETPTWISTFKEMLDFFIYSVKDSTVKMILTMLISIPIPLISVFLLKSVVDYLKEDVVLEIKSEEEEEVVNSVSDELLKLYDKNPDER